MKQKIKTLFTVILISLTLTAFGSSEPASAPSVAESDKSIVQEKLNKQDSEEHCICCVPIGGLY